MKCFFVATAILFFNIFANGDIIGTWKFTEYTYEDHTLPAPNPNLDLRFTFDQQGQSLLRWFRTDEPGFCERKADFTIKDDHLLLQKIVWINPANDISCAKDPDMQIDKETITPFRIANNKLMFDLELNGKPFAYILTQVPEALTGN